VFARDSPVVIDHFYHDRFYDSGRPSTLKSKRQPNGKHTYLNRQMPADPGVRGEIDTKRTRIRWVVVQLGYIFSVYDDGVVTAMS
jgi:hypothetical protein